MAMDDSMDQDSPAPEDTPSSNPHDSGATPVSTTQTTGVSTASASNPSGSTPATGGTGGTGGTADTSSSGGTPNAPPPTSLSNSAASKRRRGLGVVTPNACTECRKKRAKCDGQQPCSRCSAQKDVECHYEVPVRQSKENLRNEIENLRRQQASSESVISALSHNAQWEEVLRRLRSGQSVEAIADWLGSQLPSGHGSIPAFAQPSGTGTNLTNLANFAGASAASYTPGISNVAMSVATVSPTSTAHPLSSRQDMDPNSQWSQYSGASQAHSNRSDSQPDIMNWSRSGPPQTRVGSWVADNLSHLQPSDGTYRGLDQVLTPEMPPPSGLPTTWTEINSDRSLVQHLLALYFCWEYPTFASLSKEHFLKDFHSARPRYCSSILVNALLALGCRFSTQPSTRANPDDPYTSGDHFFKESLRLFFLEEDHHSLTTIQALGIMSIREASCGRDSESWYYAGQSIRLAVEMGLHRVSEDSGDSDEVAVQAATFWGAFALDHAWSLATGSLPQCSRFPHLPPKPAIMPDIEASVWIPYTDDGAPLHLSCEQPSNVRSVYKCFCELSELVHDSLYTLHTPGRPLCGPDVLTKYTQFMNWYERVPVALKLGQNFTPAVLFAHMYYHFAVLLLFRPLIKLRIKKSQFLPRDICIEAANNIQGLAKSINQGIADLTEMAPCHHFAEQALNILRYLAKKWDIKVDMDVPRSLKREKEKVHQATRTSELTRMRDHNYGTRPTTNSLNFFAPNMTENDFVTTWGNSMALPVAPEPTSPPVVRSGDSMENPLFWPFPMQGRPIMPTGDALAEAGFELL
ncbi:hypothetical protein SLS63_009956 [Diaporthe eres]|uniref:Zn(2)-C6 fungal-type domain-containing protein n=1 Tax=Diaporthe eres TaxID=83184 RepID=A0ABR1NYB2_DIAER